MNISKENIIDYIKKNRVSTTEVADALNKSGAISHMKAINKKHFRVGNVFWVYACNETNWDVHERIQEVKEGDVVFIDVFDCGDKAIFGELVAKYLLLYKQASAIVVNGNLRDAPRLLKENWPIWCSGFNPIGCNNVKIDKYNKDQIAKMNISREKYNNGIAVCDDCGVVIIPKEHHNEKFYQKMEFIEKQEDIWFECIDRNKMSTFEAVCLKKYKKNI